MKLLHTSDWHLGQNFMSKSRKDEHIYFLEWILKEIEEQKIDLLIVAGDIFDTTTPPNYALELYYNFITKLSKTSCQNVVIIAGNHDSISTLKAPKQLLKMLNVDIIVTGDEDENEIIEIKKDTQLVAVVCGVPYLRDYVVRKSFSGENLKDKEEALKEGIKEHYKNLHKKALKLKGSKDIPIIATGHLTTTGSKKSDSEREIYIGQIEDIKSDFLADMFDYVALGHLHTNQRITYNHVRYSGSPIPLSFSESQYKKVNLIEFENSLIKNISILDIPLYRKLITISGNRAYILEKLKQIEDKSTWIEVHLEDENPFYANTLIREESQELGLTLLAVKTKQSKNIFDSDEFNVVNLDELNPLEVFQKRLEKDDNLDDEKFKEDLINTFKQVVDEVKGL